MICIAPKQVRPEQELRKFKDRYSPPSVTKRPSRTHEACKEIVLRIVRSMKKNKGRFSQHQFISDAYLKALYLVSGVADNLNPSLSADKPHSVDEHLPMQTCLGVNDVTLTSPKHGVSSQSRPCMSTTTTSRSQNHLENAE